MAVTAEARLKELQLTLPPAPKPVAKYKTAVQVGLTATDNAGGSGVNKTYYTTDGSAPTTASAVYTAPFTVSATATVKFFSTDLAGNAEVVKAQLIKIDSTPPTTSLSCNGGLCAAGWYTAPVTVSRAMR